MAKVKLTVVKLPVHKDLIDQHINKDRYPNGLGVCKHWTLGQEFTIEDWPTKPDDFPCDWAWTDIQRDVAMVMFGGNPPWMKKPGTAITCCSDGLRPVSFLVERLESE
jgi:uncharacterized repeat protein (TIGR04076 family)